MKFKFLILLLLFCSGSVLAQDVGRYKSYHDKGRMLILKGKYKTAILQLDTAISIMRYYPTIYKDRGYAKMQLKDYEGALRDFDHVLEKHPYLKDVRLQRGMALFHLNHLNEAESELLLVLKDAPIPNKEASDYLHQIHNLWNQQARQDYTNQLQIMQMELERERIRRARHREQTILNTVVPLAFWTTIFLTW